MLRSARVLALNKSKYLRVCPCARHTYLHVKCSGSRYHRFFAHCGTSTKSSMFQYRNPSMYRSSLTPPASNMATTYAMRRVRLCRHLITYRYFDHRSSGNL